MERDILSPNQAAELFGIPEQAVIRLARKGIIPGRKAGRLWFFSESDLINWVGNFSQKEHNKE
jgi:excisionase family DNA binding protein